MFCVLFLLFTFSFEAGADLNMDLAKGAPEPDNEVIIELVAM